MTSMLRLAGCDFGLASIVEVGDRVRHYSTQQWGTVLEIIPQRDNTSELRVRRDPPRYPGDFTGEGWWATYHCDEHERPCQ